jgi:DNA sulfur modification protein DndE
MRLTKEVTFRLRDKKARTGLTPNLLCRLGFCLSLEEPRTPDPDAFDEEGVEFNRSTLLGEWEDVFDALLRQRLADDGLDPAEHFIPQYRAHMNRGAELICNRLRDVSDIAALVTRGSTGRTIGENTDEMVGEDGEDA